MKLVILAGGSGKRLWPVSTSKNPKQLAKLFRKETLLEATYNRLLHVAPKENIYIATNKFLAPKIQKLLGISKSNLIVEPARRDTAPAIALAVAKLLKFQNQTIGFVPADHHIENDFAFCKSIQLANQTVQKTQKFVNLGIAPTSANTGYGYLETGEALSKKELVFEFIRQVEKPNKAKAKSYIKKGFLWNGGYFFWTPKKFMESFDEHLKAGDTIKKLSKKGAPITKLYNELPKVSLDYALIEKLKPKEGATIKVDFGWEDLGSWESIHKIHPNKNLLENALHSNWHGFDTERCLIYAPKKKLVATFGIKDLVVVDTDKALLIMPKNRSGEIKNLIDLLEKNGQDKFL